MYARPHLLALTLALAGCHTAHPTTHGDGTALLRAPKLAYPPDRALIPPNLNELQIQFTAEGNNLFEVAFAGDAIALKIYTRCDAVGSGCGLTPDEATWKLLSGAGRGGTLTITVR